MIIPNQLLGIVFQIAFTELKKQLGNFHFVFPLLKKKNLRLQNKKNHNGSDKKTNKLCLAHYPGPNMPIRGCVRKDYKKRGKS